MSHCLITVHKGKFLYKTTGAKTCLYNLLKLQIKDGSMFYKKDYFRFLLKKFTFNLLLLLVSLLLFVKITSNFRLKK